MYDLSTAYEYGFCWNNTGDPDVNSNLIWTDSIIIIGEYKMRLDNLEPNTTYYFKAFINEYWIEDIIRRRFYGEEVSFTTLDLNIGNFTDQRDGQVYEWVEIGDQTWMAENLNYVTDSGSWCYNTNTSMCEEYGRLYDYKTIIGEGTGQVNIGKIRGICPEGWHIPSDDEWKQMEKFLGMSTSDANDTEWRGMEENIGGQLKSTTGWNLPNTNATNESYFSALAGGYRVNDGTFRTLGVNAYFWSSTVGNDNNIWIRYLSSDAGGIGRDERSEDNARSLRCVKD